MSGARPLYELFLLGLAANASGTAVDFADDQLHYAELGERAEALAVLLGDVGDRTPTVALLAGREPAAYEGYLGAAAAGAVVVPLDPTNPHRRNRAAIETAGVSIVLAGDRTPNLEAHVPERCGVVVRGAAGWSVVRAAGSARRRVVGEDIAYVLFTSGSTGRPKAVPVPAASVHGYVEQAVRRHEVGPDARLSHTFALTFDLAVFDLFVSWAGGATLCVPAGREQVLVPRYVGGRGLTHWFSVPSAIDIGRRMGLLGPNSLPALRVSLFCGERLLYSQTRTWHTAAPRSRIENLYGPTELTISCTAYRLPADEADWPATANGTVPIGHLHDGLEQHLEPTGDGTSELCVRGWQRFPGYLDPADDAHAFLPAADGADRWYRTGDLVTETADGLVHHGRTDEQVKIRGHRVELSEIEVAMRAHPRIRAAAVVRLDADGEPVLAGFYCAEPTLEPAELAAFLRARLPAYMLPRSIQQVDTVPLNANGKVDRRRLRDLVTHDLSRGEHHAGQR